MDVLYGIILIVMGLLCFFNPHSIKYLQWLDKKTKEDKKKDHYVPSEGFLWTMSVIGVMCLMLGIYHLVT